MQRSSSHLIDLEQHSKAEVPGLTPSEKGESGDGALKGALTGVGMAATSIFPPVGQAARPQADTTWSTASASKDRANTPSAHKTFVFASFLPLRYAGVASACEDGHAPQTRRGKAIDGPSEGLSATRWAC